MALPCGSSTPSFGITNTRAFMRLASLHRRRALDIARCAFGQDAEPARDLLIRLFDLTEVAAESVLVELLVGLEVPEAAIIRADLVGEDQPHLVMLVIESAKL